MIARLFKDTLGKLAKYPACLSLLACKFSSVQLFSLLAVEAALQLVASAQDTQQVHQRVSLVLHWHSILILSLAATWCSSVDFKLGHVLLVG